MSLPHNRLDKSIVEDSVLLYSDDDYIIVEYQDTMYSGTKDGKSMFKVREHAAKVIKRLIRGYHLSRNSV